jgi:predicted small metal-binding protein
MAKSFNCADVGKVCSWSATADNTDELMKQIVDHANHEHDIQEIPYDLKIKVESAIKDM